MNTNWTFIFRNSINDCKKEPICLKLVTLLASVISVRGYIT